MAENGNTDPSSQDQLDSTPGRVEQASETVGPEHRQVLEMGFHADSNATILFTFCVTSTAAQMFGSCVVIFIAATLYEGLKIAKEILLEEAMKLKQGEMGVTNQPTKCVKLYLNAKYWRLPMPGLEYMIQVLLHLIEVGSSYLLMLIAMTFNVWLCLSVTLGTGLGYFIFGRLLMNYKKINSDNNGGAKRTNSDNNEETMRTNSDNNEEREKDFMLNTVT